MLNITYRFKGVYMRGLWKEMKMAFIVRGLSVPALKAEGNGEMSWLHAAPINKKSCWNSFSVKPYWFSGCAQSGQ